MIKGARAATRTVSILQAVVLASAAGCHGHARADSAVPWGVSPSSALSAVPEEWLGAMAAAGAASVRGYDYRRGPAGLEPYRRAGLAVTGILMWSPKKPRSFPVHDLSSFRSYVIQTVKRFGGYIKHWEVWNEPPNGSADTSPASYAKVLSVAYDAAKSVDPQLQIGLAAKSVHLRFIEQAILAGAKGKFDFVSLHPYETAALLPLGWELPFLGIDANLRALLRATNPEKLRVPLRFTEIGVEVGDKPPVAIDEALQAATLIKIYVLGLAQQIEHIHWFDPRDSEDKHHGLLRRDGSKRPAYHALSALTRALGRKPEFKGFVSLTAHSYGFLFKARDEEVLIAWLQPGAPSSEPLPIVASSVDFGSGKRGKVSQIVLSAAPVLLTAASASNTGLGWRAKAGSELPAAWLCASGSGEVHFSAGEAPCGLHMVQPGQVAHEPGGAEVDLAGRIGARFAVDPQLVGYADQKLEITAVVRGHGRGDPGFNLKYEAQRPLTRVNDHGMVGAGGWNHIQGATPMTLRWTVKDARFVGKYGANLAIECDSSKHCDFSLLRLQVKKL